MFFKTKYNRKKTKAKFLLLFACTIMLAHAVVPHHYHDGVPFISDHEHEACSHCHTNLFANECCRTLAHEEWLAVCFFSPICTRLNSKQSADLYGFNFEFEPCFSALFSDCSIPMIKNGTGLLVEPKPYLPLYFLEHISQSLGLRAPPVC